MQDNLESSGFDVITPRDRSQRGGIITFSTVNPDDMVAYLKNKKMPETSAMVLSECRLIFITPWKRHMSL